MKFPEMFPPPEHEADTSKKVFLVPHTKNREEFDLVCAPSGFASLEDFLKSHTIILKESHSRRGGVWKVLPWRPQQPGPHPPCRFHHGQPEKKQAESSWHTRKKEVNFFFNSSFTLVYLQLDAFHNSGGSTYKGEELSDMRKWKRCLFRTNVTTHRK